MDENESGAMLAGCGKKGHVTAAANSRIQGEAVFIVFKVFVKMWIKSEDKVRLYSQRDLRGMETERD